MGKIKKADLEKLTWRDISIQKLKSGVSIIILIFETKHEGELLLKMLHNNAFSLRAFIDMSTKNYILSLEFSDSEYGIRYDTERTEVTYPPLKWIKDNEVKYITTGIWLEPTQDGFRQSWHRTDFKELGSVNLN